MSNFTWYDLIYIRPDGSEGTVFGSGETEEITRARCGDNVKYYLENGYGIKQAKILHFCQTCEGSGKVGKKKRRGFSQIFVECKACNGNPILSSEDWSEQK